MDKTECELHEQHDVQLQTQLQIKKNKRKDAVNPLPEITETVVLRP